MPNMFTEAILAVVALVIAMPPAVLAYLQWRTTQQRRGVMHLPVWSAGGFPSRPEEFRIDFVMVRAQGRGRLSNTFAEIMSQLLSSGS